MSHVVLLGDSIFDNAAYVGGHPAVIDQVKRAVPKGWQATLLAIDGSTTQDVSRQLASLPKDASHLVLSIGGNDALGHVGILQVPIATVAQGLESLDAMQLEFITDYRTMLKEVLSYGLPTVVCTIYDSIPEQDRALLAGLTIFNDAILRVAISAKVPVIDLRAICTNRADYSQKSPIEPSSLGGAKIAEAIARVVTKYPSDVDGCVVFGC